MASILIIDDEATFSTLLGSYLQQQGHSVLSAASGEEAIALIERPGQPDRPAIDIALLDIELPGMDGFETLQKLRQSSSLPVIILSARDDNPTRLLGLELGADDYVAKRTNPQELAARVTAVLRRSAFEPKRAAPDDKIQVEDVALSRRARTVSVSGSAVTLTGIEFDLLEFLLRHAGKVMSKPELSSRVFGREIEEFDRSIDVHVSRLRQKLGTRSSGRQRIENVRGKGYVYLIGD
jgi:DNA-binding response OmpR family regulator